MSDFSPHQQKIIKRYYRNFDAIKYQRLSELATELYLAQGKKRERLWKQVSETLTASRASPPLGSSTCSSRKTPHFSPAY